jgi:hypothetical protein
MWVKATVEAGNSAYLKKAANNNAAKIFAEATSADVHPGLLAI